MERPIQVGDLVQVIKPCRHCGDTRGMGYFYRVEVVEWSGAAPSDCCRNTDNEICAFPPYPELGYPLYVLKRIPPPEELGIVDEREKLTEPA